MLIGSRPDQGSDICVVQGQQCPIVSGIDSSAKCNVEIQWLSTLPFKWQEMTQQQLQIIDSAE